MSYGYPPQDPYGHQGPHDPYGQQAPQYGQPYYGPPNPPYGQPNMFAYGYPPASNGAAIGALVANVLLLVFSCGLNIFAIAGIVTAGIAVSRVNSDPLSAKSLTTWSWVIFGVLFALMVLLLGVGAAAGMFSDDGSSASSEGYEV